MSVDQSTEEWKDVVGFSGYQVSILGRVRSCRCRGRLTSEWRTLKLIPLPNGYLQVWLSLGTHQVSRYVHRLVLEAFVGPCPPGMQARHFVEKSRTNNRLDNLCWGTAFDNRNDMVVHGTQRRGSRVASAKLTEEIVASILKDAEAGVPVKELAKQHGIRKENISKIVNGHHWGHVDGPRKVHEKDLPTHVTTAEAGRLLGVTRERVQQLIGIGAIAAVKYRRGWLIDRGSVEAARSCGPGTRTLPSRRARKVG